MRYSLDALLVNRGIINARITQLVDEKTDVWGIKVQSLEMQQVPRFTETMPPATAEEPHAPWHGCFGPPTLFWTPTPRSWKSANF